MSQNTVEETDPSETIKSSSKLRMKVNLINDFIDIISNYIFKNDKRIKNKLHGRNEI